MKIRLAATIGVIGVLAALAFAPGARAQDIKAKLEAFYSRSDAMTNDKNLDGCISLMTDDYRIILSGVDREGTRSALQTVFSTYDEIQVQSTPLEISQYGEFTRVLLNSNIRLKPANGEWTEISNYSFDYLRPEGDSFKIARSVEVDKARMDFIKGETYGDTETPFVFTAPRGWEIIPAVYPTPPMQGAVLVMSPDLNSMAFMAYVKMPGLSVQQVAESDEAVTKILSTDSVYELYKSGPVNVGAHEGFETESKIILPGNADIRHRHRVYFKARGTLYVLMFDAIPFNKWDEVKEEFKSILASINVDD